ncbi:MAG: NAD+ synthase [Candidatus Omnitrophica bacterium]|nr:NAD+ synthase [Candidatus Omnitrophota bacterium]
MLRVALAQINPTLGAFENNQKRMQGFLELAQKQEADLIIFPELVICGYPPEDLLYQEQFFKDNQSALKNFAKNVTGITAVVGFVDQDAKGHLYNAAALIAEGKVQGVYHKHCLPNYGVFDEKRYFKIGTQNLMFGIGDTCAAVNICEDIWDDKGPWNEQIKAGAKLIINISASPYEMQKLDDRKKMLKRCAGLGAHVCYVNLVGGQDELVFDGNSMVMDSQGKTIAQARSFEEDLLVVDVKVPAVRKLPVKAVKSFNKINLKKKVTLSKCVIAKVDPIAEVYKALVLGTRDYVHKSGFKKVVIGISGGIDSALVACIACDALGQDNVVGISMPSRFNSDETKSDARTLAHHLKMNFKQISIERVVGAFDTILDNDFYKMPKGLAEENIQARIRGNILMAFSNKFGWLVLTTGNKSEMGVGYCTLYGDMCGGYAVIKDVPKILVFKLARYCNSQTLRIPQSIIDRPPSAELRPNQKDQDSLPPYDVLDAIMEQYVEQHQSYKNIIKKFDPEIVKQVIRLIDRSEYKRRQAPPGIKITSRAFGKDWRLPITNGFDHHFE